MKSNPFNQRGFGLIELTVATLITGIVGLTAAGLMTVVVKNKKAVQKDLSTTAAQILSIQLAKSQHSSEVLIKNSLSLPQTDCLRGGGEGCQAASFLAWRPLSMPDHIDTYFDTNRTCSGPNQGCPFERRMQYRMLCDSPTKCDGVEVHMGMYERSDGIEKQLFSHRFSVDYRDLVPPPQLDWSTCGSRGIIGIDFSKNELLCRDNFQRIFCDGYSVVGVGPASCGTIPSLAGTEVCGMNFENPRNLSITVSGQESLALDINCTLSNGQGQRMKDILYFAKGFEGRMEFQPQYGRVRGRDVTLSCEGTMRGLMGDSSGFCMASITLNPSPPPRSSASGNGTQGNGNTSSGLGSSGASTSAGVSMNVGGTGASFSAR